METSGIRSGKNFVIGPFIVDPSRNILRYDSDLVSLEPKIMDVLVHLILRQGEVCSREDIIAAVWNVEFGADESLTRSISIIRKAFRTAGGQRQYIQTISKRGYSLQEPISELKMADPKKTPLAAPSVIRETETTSASLVSKTGTETTALAKPQVPKTRNPTRLFAFPLLAAATAAAAFIFWPEPFGSELPGSAYGRSVTVMPFVDLSEDGKHRYFSEGLAEELSNELRKINSLRVVGQRLGGASDYASMSYEEIGDKLKVSHIVHGSVRKQEDRVRITAQMINTEDNSHAWSSTYDGTLKDVFDLQQRVAFDIRTELSLMLSMEFSEPIELDEIALSTLGPDPR